MLKAVHPIAPAYIPHSVRYVLKYLQPATALKIYNVVHSKMIIKDLDVHSLGHCQPENITFSNLCNKYTPPYNVIYIRGPPSDLKMFNGHFLVYLYLWNFILCVHVKHFVNIDIKNIYILIFVIFSDWCPNKLRPINHNYIVNFIMVLIMMMIYWSKSGWFHVDFRIWTIFVI